MWNLTSSGKKEYMTPCPAQPSPAVIYFLRWDLTPRGLGLHLPSCPQRRLHQHSSPCWPVCHQVRPRTAARCASRSEPSRCDARAERLTSWSLSFPNCRERAVPPLSTGSRASWVAVKCPFPGCPLTTHRLFQQILPGLLLLLWLPTSTARHGPPLWGSLHTHGAPRCYSPEELPPGQVPPHLLARAAKWEQALPVALVSSLEATGRRRRQEGPLAETQCPVLGPEEVLEADIHQRSISPWRYRVDTDESRYPQKLAFAECLCKGCISTRTGRETAALNSVPLHQSLLVLRRRPCAPDATGVPVPGAFTFHVEFIRVPVGCTCVLPRTAR
nr:PREDICTED: interleukin-17C [Equus przewalskii]